MASKLEQTRSSIFISSLEGRINALDLQTAVSIDDVISTNTFGHFAKRVQSLNEVNNVNKENPQNPYR